VTDQTDDRTESGGSGWRAAGRTSRGRIAALLLGAAPALLPASARAEAWNEGWTSEWNHRLTIGAQLRTEARDPALVGKANLDPQLCAADDCLSASPDNTGPNERYLAAPGARNMVYDDGNLNYDRGDLIASPAKWTTRLQTRRDNLIVEIGALAFYDFTNEALKENHPNQIVQPGPQPGQRVRNKRDREVIRDIGYDLQLLDSFVQDTFEIFDRPLDLGIGRQRIIWGESSFVTQGSLNVINPPDGNSLVRPGQHFEEVYLPVGMLLARMPLTDELSTEAFYQFEWRPVSIPPRGSYFSFFNAGNEPTPNEGIAAPFAKIPYDPEQIGTPANDVFALVTQSSFTLRRAPNREPDGMGQFGMALYYHPEWMEGAELGLYAANYHSRIPTASATASDASCARREGNPSGIDAVDLTSFVAACGVPGTHLRDAAPLDSVQYFIEYPEDIHLFGLSFSTLAAGIAVRGELAYRPNQPVQVDLEDVLFAAFQPALPRQDVPLFGTAGTLPGLITALQDPDNVGDVLLATINDIPGALSSLNALLTAPNLLGTTVPSSRRIPDYVTEFRGGTPGEIVPGQYIRGYERMKVAQASLGLTRIFGNAAMLGTTDSLLLFEITGIWLPELPAQSQLQFEGPGTDTHAGPGAQDTGNALFLNPVRNTGGYVTSFSWGYRAGVMLHYSDVLAQGFNLRPLLVFTHDVSGVSPGLGENFLEGRRIGIVDLRLNYGAFDASLAQTFIFGGGNRNTLHDRDFFTASIGMRF